MTKKKASNSTKTDKTAAQKSSPPSVAKQSFVKRIFSLRHKISKKVLIVVSVVLVIALITGLTYGYVKAKSDLKKYNDPKIAIQQETSDTVDQVGKIMILPQGEQPTVATVSDTSKLKDKPFFSNAKNGDTVLVYQQAKKAILYRPSTKQVVEVATYNSDQSGPASTKTTP